MAENKFIHMNIKHGEIEIDEYEPFTNCKLDRQKYAYILTNIINSYPTGFVLALNNKWGAGKTTFVKMWQKDLDNQKFKTLYFNAWENDFENDPLTALMGELKTLTKRSTELKFKDTLKQAAVLTKNIAPLVAKAVADRYVDTDKVKDIIVGVTKGLSDVFEHEVQEYAKKKKSISDFKQSLSQFIESSSGGKPLIFFVDELDRCRPNYAVSTLEQIKHFFSVPNIVFVLSIDKEQLGSAIKGVYGSDEIDAEEYLRRFIDIEYTIPEPKTGLFYNYLYNFFQFDSFFMSPERVEHRRLNSDKSNFLRTCEMLFTNTSVPLRQQEKIFAHSRLALRSFTLDMYVTPHIFLLLTFIKIRNNAFYELMKSRGLSIQEVQENFLDLIKIGIDENTERPLMLLELDLVNTYNNSLPDNRKTLYEEDSELHKKKLRVTSIISNEPNSTKNILEIIHNRERGDGKLELSHYTNRIDLLEDMET